MVAVAVAAAAAALPGAKAGAAGTPTAEVAELHFRMATPVLVVARGHDERLLRAAVRQAFTSLRRLEERLSTFIASSDASRLNEAAGRGAILVSPDLSALLATSTRLAADSRGSFSILVGPLVELWHRAAESGIEPDARAIAAARSLVDPAGLVVVGNRARLARAGMRIDLGGIAKGFAADRLLAGLREAGAEAALVNLGGSSIAAFGDAADGGRGWPIELPQPDGDTAGPAPILRLRNAALSTSATRGHVLAVGSRTIGHIVDPRTGLPLALDATAVVRHRSATVAEADSKALLVLDAEAGFEVLRAHGADGIRVAPGAPIACSAGFRAEVPACRVGAFAAVAVAPERSKAQAARTESQ